MMSRTIVNRLRVFAIVALCGIFYACAQQQPANVAEDQEPPPCPATENYVVCFFADARLMGEVKDQFREVRRALVDALELPIEELRKPRYAMQVGMPQEKRFDEVISGYFHSRARLERSGTPPEISRISPHDTDEFYEALKAPEAIPVLKYWIEELEAAIEQAWEYD